MQCQENYLKKARNRLTAKLKEVNKCLYYLNLENFNHDASPLYDYLYEDHIHINYNRHIDKIRFKKEKSPADLKNLVNYAILRHYWQGSHSSDSRNLLKKEINKTPKNKTALTRADYLKTYMKFCIKGHGRQQMKNLLYLKLGQINDSNGDEQRAVDLINMGIDSCMHWQASGTFFSHNGAGLYFERALINYRNGNYKDALHDLNNAINTKENNCNDTQMKKNIFWERVKNNDKLKNYQSVINDLSYIIELDAYSKKFSHEDILNIKNYIKYFEKNLDKSVNIELKFLKLNDESPALYDSFDVDINCKNYCKYIAKLRSDINKNNKPESLLHLAVNKLISYSIVSNCRPGIIIIPFQKKVKENYFDYYYSGLQNFYVFKNYDMASRDFKRAVAMKKCTSAFKMLGLSEYINGCYANSIAALTNSIKYRRGLGNSNGRSYDSKVRLRYIYYKRAMAKLKLKNYKGAMDDFNNSLKSHDGSGLERIGIKFIEDEYLYWGMALTKIKTQAYAEGVELLNKIKNNHEVDNYKNFIVKKHNVPIKKILSHQFSWPKNTHLYDKWYDKDALNSYKYHVGKMKKKSTKTKSDIVNIINQMISWKHCSRHMFGPSRVIDSIRCGNFSKYGDHYIKFIDLGLYEIHVNNNIKKAEYYFKRGKHSVLGNRFSNEAVPKFDCMLSYINDLRGDYEKSINYMNNAITLIEKKPESNRYLLLGKLKYLYVKRGLLKLENNDTTGALDDFNNAYVIIYTSSSWGRYNEMDDVVIWEKIKTYDKIGYHTSAINYISQLIDMKVGDKDNEMVELLNDYKKKIDIGAKISEDKNDLLFSKEESVKNYDNIYVNVKCKKYQKFIAKIQESENKSLYDWKCLVCYEMQKFERSYIDSLVNPECLKLPKNLLVKDKWKAGLKYYYITNDYSKASQIFEKKLSQKNKIYILEMVARAKFKNGDYFGVISVINSNLHKYKNNRGEFNIQSLWNLYCLIGMAYHKTNNAKYALYNYNAALKLSGNILYNDKLATIPNWLIGQVYLDKNDYLAAIKNLEKSPVLYVSDYIKALIEQRILVK